MEARLRISGKFQDPEIWDIKVNRQQIGLITSDNIHKHVNEIIEQGEKDGLCERTPLGFVLTSNK